MIVLNMGIPRSGTVWAFNVLRLIFDEHEVPFTPANANSPEEIDAALAAHASAGTDAAEHLIAHFHDITPAVERAAGLADNHAFFNYRDPRDVVCSQMRLHDADFDIACEMTANAFRLFDKVLAMPRVMLLPYPHVVDHPAALIYQMGLSMGFLMDLGTVERIAAATSRDKHKKVMEAVPQGEGASDEKVLKSFSGKRWVTMDRTHLINDRHIQSGATGRWRDELTPAQQDRVNRVFAHPIRMLGFDAPDPAGT